MCYIPGPARGKECVIYQGPARGKECVTGGEAVCMGFLPH